MRAIVVVVTAALFAGGCSKTANIQLKLVEPCDQKNQALNGIGSFRVSSTGSDADGAVSFITGQPPAQLPVGLGSDVIVTVQAFTDAGGAATTGASPKSVGRTLPLKIDEQTGDVTSIVTMGQLDSFGRTTSTDGVCTQMSTGRHGHTATYLPQINKVLIVGGAQFDSTGKETFLATAELFDPADGSYTPIDLPGTRAYHAATALPDGRVVITGGLGFVSGAVSALQTGLIFDPTLFAEGQNPFVAFLMKQPRAHHTSTLMPDANLVVIMGGCVGITEADGCTSTAAGQKASGAPSTALTTLIETFDTKQPTAAATTAAVPSTVEFTQRAFHQATLLDNGAASIIVVTGGVNVNGPVAPIELYQVTAGALTKVAAPLAPFPDGKAPARHAAVAIDAHRLLVIGGQTQAPGGETRPLGNDPPGTADVWLFQDATGIDQTETITLFNSGGRVAPEALKLNDGSIVVIGGALTSQDAPTAEELRVGEGVPFKPEVLSGPPIGEAREDAALAVFPTNGGVYCGGYDSAKKDSTACEIFFGP